MERGRGGRTGGRVAEGGGCGFRVCRAGVHDWIALSDRAIYVYFSRERDEGCGRLDEATLTEIRDWVAQIPDVFQVQQPVYGAGNEELAYILVRQDRTGKLAWSFPEQYAWVKLLRRYEVWQMHKPGKEWQIQKRYFVCRKLSGDKGEAPLKVIVAPALGGHVLDVEHSELRIELKLEDTGEVVIPPAEQEAANDVQ